MPSAGAKLQLGPPLLLHMSVRNLSSQPQATRTTKTTLGNNATAETNNGDGVRAAGIDAGASRDEQSTKNTSSQSKSQSPAVRTTTTTTTTNQPPRGTAYLARQSVIIHTQEPQPIPVHTHTYPYSRVPSPRAPSRNHDPDLFPSPPVPAPPPTPAPTAPFAFARACRN
ncbi:hypothetical protein CNYM01_12885, partial [Colletotrichum nymphaeae SA-01]